MKCPKCQYLGFETGDRCRNCGYDFSLIEFRSAVEDDMVGPGQRGSRSASPESTWDTFDAARDVRPQTDATLHEVVADHGAEPPLPLFALTAEDQPLVRLPVTPRRPLAVRRTAEQPRPRTTPRQLPQQDGSGPQSASEPELDFPEEASLSGTAAEPPAVAAQAPAAEARRVPSPAALLNTSSPRRRFMAAGIDYALLAGIDAAIVYFTVRMAGLDMSDWRLLPVVPLTLFLGVIALAYVGVFTAVGGQTIGKMAARIRVVPEDPVPVGAAHAARRTAAVMLSWLTGGLGFLPALVGDHRALHDRLSRTRVVDLA